MSLNVYAEACAGLVKQVSANGWQMKFYQTFEGWRVYARRGNECQAFGPDHSKSRIVARVFEYCAAAPKSKRNAQNELGIRIGSIASLGFLVIQKLPNLLIDCGRIFSVYNSFASFAFNNKRNKESLLISLLFGWSANVRMRINAVALRLCFIEKSNALHSLKYFICGIHSAQTSGPQAVAQ